MKKKTMMYRLASGMAFVAALVVAPASWLWVHQAKTPTELLKK